MTDRKQAAGQRTAQKQARELDRAKAMYLEPLLEPGEEFLSCAAASRAKPGKQVLVSATTVGPVAAALLYLGNTFPEVRYLIAAVGGASTSLVGSSFRERVWVGVTSGRVLFVAKVRMRPPAVLLDEPAFLMQPAIYRRHVRTTSLVRWELPGGRGFTLRGGTGFTELMDSLTSHDQAALAD